jgi:3-hydroxybutyrate dehydrogenase
VALLKIESKNMTEQKRVAFITGSTSGIGLGIAKSLAKSGCNIAINGFGTVDEIEKICSTIAKEFNVKVIFVSADVTDYLSLEKAFQKTSQEIGAIDILVNNAGIQHVSGVAEFPLEKWKQIIDTNLNGVFYGIRAVLPSMLKKNYGRIINIASVHGIVASANKAAYVAAKHGVIGLTKVTALENATHNITCNAICPGWVLTPLVQKQIDAKILDNKLSMEVATAELLSEKQPNGRFASPEEIGDMVVYLTSNSARGITGSSFTIDGGWTAQ